MEVTVKYIATKERYKGDEKVTKVIIEPDAVIQARAFADCSSLETIEIQGPVSFEIGAFLNCTSLKEVIGSEHIVIYPKKVFKNTPNLKHIKLGPDVQVIDFQAFANSGLQEVDLTNVKEIDTHTFYECISLRNVTWSKYVDVIPECTFYRAGMEEFYVPSNVREIGFASFRDSDIADIDFSDACNLTEVESFAFYYTHLKTVDLSNTVVTSDPSAAFDSNVDVIMPYYAI